VASKLSRNLLTLQRLPAKMIGLPSRSSHKGSPCKNLLDPPPLAMVWRSYKEGFSGLNTSLVRKVGRELSPRGYRRILASKEVLRCTWLLLL
jgi:hypothetical protein